MAGGKPGEWEAGHAVKRWIWFALFAVTLIVLSLLQASSSFASGTVVYYPSYGTISGVPYLSYSGDYSVEVNGTPIEVLRSENDLTTDPLNQRSEADAAHFAMFAFEDTTVTVEITCNFTVNTVKIKPTSYGISHTVSGNVITFTLSGNNKFIDVEVNGYTNPLFIFAEAPETNVPSSTDPDIIWYGPGVHDIGFQKDIPAGKTLYISPGAILKGNLWANHQDDVKILGRGILSGGGWSRDKNGDGNYTAIGAWQANNLEINGPLLINHPYLTIGDDGRDVVIKNVKIIGWAYNTDGFNIYNNTQVSDSFVMANDDQLRLLNGAHDANINRVVLWHIKGGNVFVDDRMTQHTRNIEYRDIDIVRNEAPPGDAYGQNFNLHLADANGYMSNIRFINVNIEDSAGKAINFDLTHPYPWYLLLPAYERANFRDILFSNWNVPSGMTTNFAGLNNKSTIENLSLNNFKYNGSVANNLTQANAATNDHVKNVSFNTGMLVLTGPNYNELFDTGSTVVISAEPYEISPSLAKVEFYVDGKKVGEDNTHPYSHNWTSTRGMHTLQAKGIGSSAYWSAKMRIGVGDNVLSNPGFEDVDMSMWVPMESGVTVSRVASFTNNAGHTFAPKSGSYLAKTSAARPSFLTFRQDVTSQLQTKGQGTYGLQASMLYNNAWVGYKAILKITDALGTHYYESKGQEREWTPTLNLNYQNIEWTGALTEAIFYFYTSSDDVGGDVFPIANTLGAVAFDDAKLNFIGGNVKSDVVNSGFEADGVVTYTPIGWTNSGTANAAYTDPASNHTGGWGLTHSKTSAYNATSVQTVANLSNGTYKLTAWVRGSGTGTHQMSAGNFGGSTITKNITTTADWQRIEIDRVLVTNGQCDITFYSSSTVSDWMSVDDVELIPVNAVKNPGFENVAPSQTPDGWLTWTSTGSQASDFTNNDPHWGLFSLVHSSTSPYTLTTYQLVTDLPNGTYDLSAWVKGGGAGYRAMAATNFGSSRTQALSLTGSWQKVEIANINVTNGQCQIEFYTNSTAGGDWMEIDDVELVRSTNYLQNPGFEANDAAVGTPHQWTKLHNTDAAFTHSDAALAGKYGLEFYKPTSFIVEARQSAGIPDGTYTLKVWIRGNTPGGYNNVTVNDYGGTEMAIVYTPSTTWQQYTIDNITVTSGQIRVGFYTSVVSGAWVLFDNVELIKN